jgi:hypothetical protein
MDVDQCQDQQGKKAGKAKESMREAQLGRKQENSLSRSELVQKSKLNKCDGHDLRLQ